jgi:hypothetical protein
MNKVTLWLVAIFVVGAVEVADAQQPKKVLRGVPCGQLPAHHVFRGQNLEGSQARRFAGRAAHEIRVGDQSQDCQADRPHNSAEGAGAGG